MDDKLLERIKKLEVGEHIELPVKNALEHDIRHAYMSLPSTLEWLDKMYKLDLVFVHFSIGIFAIFRKIAPLISIESSDTVFKSDFEDEFNRELIEKYNKHTNTNNDPNPIKTCPPLAEDIKSEAV